MAENWLKSPRTGEFTLQYRKIDTYGQVYLKFLIVMLVIVIFLLLLIDGINSAFDTI